ncbi:MAG TPA: FISUMP domain-containing protein [Thermotogota bacterium]|nr:FISUMP domain-containing protein [Thermotogota bacterium]HRW94194.1 FISUMP domain-containing protein [Thermotogota bacterium]
MRKVFVFILLVIGISMVSFASEGYPAFSPEIVSIGQQVWMLRNYHPSMFASPPSIKGVSYNFLPDVDPVYGTLLTFEEALAACPPGWHLPSMEEWNVLFAAYGGIEQAGGHLKTREFWKAPNTGADNLSGFSALPAGGGNDTNRFDGFGWSAHFWSSTLKDGKASVPSLMHDSQEVYVLEIPVKMRASVRYVMDATSMGTE